MDPDTFVGTPDSDMQFSDRPFIYGLNGNDTLVGQGDAATQIYGGQGNDELAYNTGGASAKLYGDDGDDVVTGGAHNDILSGGDGADIFGFEAAFGPGNVDTILDFQPGVDHIGLDLKQVLGGSVSKGEFRLGSKALDKNDHLLYDSKHGKLFYDDDGKGGDHKVLFAVLQKHLDLDHHDFLIAV